MITNIPCVILSGGKSSRMKEDKSFLSFDSNSNIIQYQYNRLSKIFTNVYISSKIDKFDFEVELILDNSSIYSPMVALYSILKKFNGKVFIITVDNPFIKKNTITNLINNSNDYDITIAKTPLKTHSLCGVFSSNLVEKVEENLSLDMHKINHLIINSLVNIIEFDNEDEFLNINTKEDYIKALELL